MNWKKFWFLLIPLILVISFGIISSIYEKNNLKTCSKESFGIVFKIYEIVKRGHFVQYKYTVNNKQYKTSEGIKTKDELAKLKIGDTITIHYSCDYPDFSKYISTGKN